MKTILSIDGGGIRGLIPALILAHLESLTGRPSHQLFDLMVGTSTGGLLVSALARPDSDGSGVMYSASDLADLYLENGSRVFERSFFKRVSSLGGLSDEIYSSEGIDSVLLDYLGDMRLGDALTPVTVTAYDIEQRETRFFKSWHPRFESLLARDVCRATTAAPSYFEPSQFELDGEMSAFIDGGIFINSPAVSAYAEAVQLFPGEELRVVSLGTGQCTRRIPFDDARDWGRAGWLRPLIDSMFDGLADAVDHQMQHLLGERYHRFQVSLHGASDDMDDTSEENLLGLKALASGLIRERGVELEGLAGVLVG
ncbi:patatin-like phospholipase family protein [Solemya elarraichensis gill symbiont]|uniref:Patatin n=1 Tax=Solemya elarraichensis gill symbiont TaxID=1918949 RepID=A0A1T2L737_9GAMM|nr:patatin-like phospholipase family protein [Solemya elarraichensis gill symbiont]OOZ40919.1 patatin [Solemya elarraichensis gill symbiont]